MKTFTADVRINGSKVPAQLQARDISDARKLFAAQYGASNVSFVAEVK